MEIETGKHSWQESMDESTHESGSETESELRYDEEETLDGEGDEMLVEEKEESDSREAETNYSELGDEGNPLDEKDAFGKSNKEYSDEYNKPAKKRGCPGGGSSQAGEEVQTRGGLAGSMGRGSH